MTTSAASVPAYETVPFDVTVRVSDTAIRKEYQAMLGHVRDMLVAQVADQVGVARHLIDYDRLTVTRTDRRSLREVWFTTRGTWVRRVADHA